MPADKRVEPHEAAMIRRYLEEASLSTAHCQQKCRHSLCVRLRLKFGLFDAPHLFIPSLLLLLLSK
jgi:hypothetical protein